MSKKSCFSYFLDNGKFFCLSVGSYQRTFWLWNEFVADVFFSPPHHQSFKFVINQLLIDIYDGLTLSSSSPCHIYIKWKKIKKYFVATKLHSNCSSWLNDIFIVFSLTSYSINKSIAMISAFDTYPVLSNIF